MRFFAAAAASAVALACAALGAQAADELVIKIGHAAPLTTDQAHIGKDNENGVRLAIEELNAKGVMIGGKKAKFEMTSLDDQHDGKLAATVAQKFVDMKVNGVIGHLNSGATIPASDVYARAGIPQISPSATAIKYTARGLKTAFRVMANDSQQGKALAQFAVKGLKGQRIVVIDDKTDYGTGLADEFAKGVVANGGKVVKREYTTDKSTDFRAILTNIKPLNPDVVFYGGMDPQAAPLLKQMRELGIQAKLLGGDGITTENFLKNSGKAGEGTYASIPGVPVDKMQGGTDFRKKFEAKFGRKIELYAPYCYDAMMVMADAMQRANSAEPAKYLPEIAKTQFKGVTGTIQFDAKGDLTNGNITVYQAKAGKWEAVETIGGAK